MFLEECVDSLLKQTVLPHKIIFADDASTDDSPEIMQRYLEKYPNLFWICRQEQNVGTINNENHATEFVRTPWMFFLDADDKVDPQYIEKVVNRIERGDNKLAIVYSDMQKFGNWDGLWAVQDWDPEGLRSGNYINGHSVFRTDLFREIGMLKDGPGFEDHQLWVDIVDLNRGYYGVHIPEPLVWYRRHDHGHRTDKSDKSIRENYVKSNNEKNDAIV